jgi:hypothetical protein
MGHVLMAQELVIAPAGLWTDPNPLSAAPAGAMTEALNVVIARPGVVEPRPGLQAQSSFTSIAVDEDIVRMIPFEGDILVLTKDVSDGTGHAYWFTANDDITQTNWLANTSAWGLTVGQCHGASVRGNLYVSCTEGAFRCIDPGDDTARRAGLIRANQGHPQGNTSGGVNYPLAADTAVAYRFCTMLQAGNVTVRSAPSARFLARSYTGSSPKRVINISNFSTAIDDADAWELYRSTAFASAYEDTPTDEMSLIGSVDGSGLSDDVAVTGLRGPALYTNATQQSALLENGITPLCRDVATFREMLFFAGAKWAPKVTVDILGFGDDWRGTNVSTNDRITRFTIAGTTTNTSTTVSGVSASDIAKLRTRMRVCLSATANPASADATFPAETYVTSINVGAGTFVISNAATTTGAVTIAACDWLEFEVVTDASVTTTNRLFVADSTNSTTCFVADEFGNTTAASVDGPQALAHMVRQAFYADLPDNYCTLSCFGDGVVDAWTLVFEAWRYDIATATVRVSNSNATPDQVTYNIGKSASRGGSVAMLAWSKPGEPEHVPPGYFAEIGAADKAIERIIATRDALIVFKEDGVWRVSGYSPDTLQVDEFDRTMRLVHPDAACEWDGLVAAWTNKGVMLIGGGGAQEISLPIANLIEAAGETHAGNAAKGVFLCGWLDKGLLLLGIPSSTSTGYAEYVYCWSQRTGAWTRWSHSSRITTACAVGKDLYFGTRAADASSDAVVLKAVAESFDVTTSVTVSAVSGTGITISGGSGWTPAIGDILRQSSVDYAVTAITSSTVFTVHTTGVTAAAAAALTRSAMQVEWTVRDGENAGGQKLFREMTAVFGSAAGLVANDNAYTTDRSQTSSTSTSTMTYTASDVPTTIRTRIPRESRRCGRLEHAMTMKGAKPGWQLHGASYVYEPLSTRFRDAS